MPPTARARSPDSVPPSPPATAKSRRALAARIVEALGELYPDAACALHHRNAYELLVATVLSAQCTDEQVNRVTPALFARFPDAAALAAADLDEVTALVRPTGFFRNKALNIVGAARGIVDRHGGEVPGTMEELTALPGVGRKTANVVLGNAFGVPGLTVDTHMGRLVRRFGLTREQDPVKVEFALMNLVDRERWTWFSHAVIRHGRLVCHARKPRCGACALAPWCPRVGA